MHSSKRDSTSGAAGSAPHEGRSWALFPHGLLVFERTLGPSGPFQLLMSKVLLCTEPLCDCRDVQLTAVAVDLGTDPSRADLDSEKLDSMFAGSEAMNARLDLDVGLLDPDDHDGRNPLSSDWLEYVQSQVDGELLDQLHERWLRAKGLPQKDPREIDWHARPPGDLVGWHEAHSDDRRDLYLDEDDGAVFMADDLYCVNPSCDCAEATIDFAELLGGGRARSIGHVLVRIPDAHPLERKSPTGKRALVDRLWAAFQARHRRLPERLAERKQRMTDLAQPRSEPLPAKRSPLTAAPRVGRNQPCPCGSGKKFKRCCGR